MNIHENSKFGFLFRTLNAAAGLLPSIRRQKGLLLLGLLPIVVGAVRPASAQKIPITPIDHCGTTISKPGYYAVTQELQGNSNSVDCIQISSPGIRLWVDGGDNLIGPGGAGATSAGIRILKSAYGPK